MSWTKKELIEQAFDAIGIATYSFDLEPEQYQSALKKLDSMMAQWHADGIKLGYPLYSVQTDSNIEEESNVPDWSYSAIYSNLGIKIAPSFGKVVSPELKEEASDGKDTLYARLTRPPSYQVTGLPRGQGAKYWRGTGSTTLPSPTDVLTDGSSDTIE